MVGIIQSQRLLWVALRDALLQVNTITYLLFLEKYSIMKILRALLLLYLETAWIDGIEEGEKENFVVQHKGSDDLPQDRSGMCSIETLGIKTVK